MYQLKHETENRLYRYHEIVQELPGITLSLMEYNSLILACPVAWKSIIKLGNWVVPEKSKFQIMEEKPSFTKYGYWFLVEEKGKFIYDACMKLWEKDLGIQIGEEKWEEILDSTRKITNSTKMRYFQYQILNRIITTNIRRAKYMQISEMCYFCNTEPETLIHLMYNCGKVEQLRKALIIWLKRIGITITEITREEVILNTYKGKEAQMMKTVILLMKRYIYVSKCMEKD